MPSYQTPHPKSFYCLLWTILDLTLSCLHQVISLPYPGANDLDCCAVKQHLTPLWSIPIFHSRRAILYFTFLSSLWPCSLTHLFYTITKLFQPQCKNYAEWHFFLMSWPRSIVIRSSASITKWVVLISQEVWPTVTKFYGDICTGLVCSDIGYDITSYFLLDAKCNWILHKNQSSWQRVK